MRSPRRSSKGIGWWSTARCWRHGRAWCGSPPAATPPISRFLDNHKGSIVLNSKTVTAVVDSNLPRDSVDQLASIGRAVGLAKANADTDAAAR